MSMTNKINTFIQITDRSHESSLMETDPKQNISHEQRDDGDLNISCILVSRYQMFQDFGCTRFRKIPG